MDDDARTTSLAVRPERRDVARVAFLFDVKARGKTAARARRAAHRPCKSSVAMRRIPPGSAKTTAHRRADAIARAVQRLSLPGTVIDGWSIERLLAVGSSCVLYAATTAGGERAALKVFVDDEDPRSHGGFRRERAMTELAARAGAPHLFGALVTPGGRPALLLELLEGRSLLEHWAARRERFDALTTLTLADKILGALERLHDAGIVHGAVEPRHVFVTDDDEVRLIDFGRAELLRGRSVSAWSDEARPDRSTDVLAVAATLYSLLAGAPQRAIAIAANDDALSLGPRALREVLEVALHSRPEQRFADASAMRAALRAVFDDYLTTHATTHASAPR